MKNFIRKLLKKENFLKWMGGLDWDVTCKHENGNYIRLHINNSLKSIITCTVPQCNHFGLEKSCNYNKIIN
jgi:hypothetical protein